MQDLEEETQPNEDEPCSLQPDHSRGDKNLWIILTAPHLRWIEIIPVVTLGLFFNPLESLNINTLTYTRHKGYLTLK